MGKKPRDAFQMALIPCRMESPGYPPKICNGGKRNKNKLAREPLLGPCPPVQGMKTLNGSKGETEAGWAEPSVCQEGHQATIPIPKLRTAQSLQASDISVVMRALHSPFAISVK